MCPAKHVSVLEGNRFLRLGTTGKTGASQRLFSHLSADMESCMWEQLSMKLDCVGCLIHPIEDTIRFGRAASTSRERISL